MCQLRSSCDLHLLLNMIQKKNIHVCSHLVYRMRGPVIGFNRTLCPQIIFCSINIYVDFTKLCSSNDEPHSVRLTSRSY